MAKQEVGNIALRGSLIVGGAQVLRVMAMLVSTILVARLLSPDDYGVVSMTAPITALLVLLQKFGVTDAAVQAPSLSNKQTNSLMWFNILVATFIALVLLALSPLAGLFYNDSRVAYYSAASASVIFISGFSLLQMALLTRELRFKEIASIELFAALVNVGVSIAFAYVFRNYWAIFAGQISSVITVTLLSWTFCRWRPDRRFSLGGIRNIVTFGGTLTGFQLLNYLSRHMDSVLIGKVWGATQLGLYNVSYKLMLFPLNNINYPLSRVMLPLLATIRDDDDRYRHVFLFALRGVVLLTVPGLVTAAVLSEKLLPWLLGDQWSAVSPLFFWLVLAGLSQPISNVVGWLFISRRRGVELVKFGVLQAVTLMVAFGVGVVFGAKGVAIAYFVAMAVLSPCYWAWGARGTPVQFSDILKVLLPIVVSLVFSAMVIYSFKDRAPFILTFFCSIIFAYVISIVSVLLCRDGRINAYQFLALLKAQFPSGRWRSRSGA